MSRIISTSARWALTASLFACLLWVSPLFGEVITTGDVQIADHGGKTHVYVGETGYGMLTINNGSTFENFYSIIGYEAGSSGAVIVDGAGSTWTSDVLRIGNYRGSGVLAIINGGQVNCGECSIDGWYGTGVVTVEGAGSKLTSSRDFLFSFIVEGTLNILNGGEVETLGDVWVAHEEGREGQIHFEGGILTTDTLLAAPTNLTGTGTIYAHGLVSDADLVFDSTDDLTQTLVYDSLPGQNITLHATIDGQGRFGAGCAGNASVTIRDGFEVVSRGGMIGAHEGSTGVVTVDGPGSTWTSSDDLYIGQYGQGTLNILNGATVNSDFTSLGQWLGASGTVTVDGPGSTWNCLGLDVGFYDGQGRLEITNGGMVNCLWGAGIGITDEAMGIVTVDGAGSTWSTGGFCVGQSGSGALLITHGGIVDGDVGVIGGERFGVVTVDGPGSMLSIHELLVVGGGVDGHGELNIVNGGLVCVGGQLQINGDSYINIDSCGMLAIQGQVETLDEFLDLIGGTDAILGISGKKETAIGLAVQNTADRYWVGDDAADTVYITFDNGAGTDVLTVAVGNGSMTLQQVIDAINVQSRAIEDGWNAATAYYDEATGLYRLKVESRVTGNEDAIVVSNAGAVMWAWPTGVTNAISNADFQRISGSSGSGDYTLEYISEGELAGYAMLTVGQPPLIPGDYNRDGKVDLADYTVWADHFGQSGSNLPGDGNGDGTVDLADYTVWADHYGLSY